MKTYLKALLISAVLVIIFIFGMDYVFGAPSYTIMRSIFPESSSNYDVGSSTRSWRAGYFDNLYSGGFQVSTSTGSGSASATTTINGISGPTFTFSSPSSTIRFSTSTGNIFLDFGSMLVSQFTNDSNYIATTTGNWLGTWQSKNPSDFLSSSTAYESPLTFSTSTDTNLGVVISRSLNNINFTPTWIGTLADNRITSAATWNNKLSTTTPLTAGYIGMASSSPVGITNSNIFQLGSNVGIGTTTPATALQVIGTSTMTNANITGTATIGTLNGLIKGTSGVLSAVTDNSSNWDTAYTDRLKWDGGVTDLVAATGRASLGLGTLATANSVAYASTTGVQATMSAGTGINLVGAQINNSGVLTLTAGTDITITTATGTPTIGNTYASSTWAKVSNNLSDVSSSTARTNLGVDQSFIPWTVSGETSNNKDIIHLFRSTSTITKVLAANKTAGDTVTFNLAYNADCATATSSFTNSVFSTPQTVGSTTSTVLISLASSTPGINSCLVYYTNSASSSEFHLDIYYTTP